MRHPASCICVARSARSVMITSTPIAALALPDPRCLEADYLQGNPSLVIHRHPSSRGIHLVERGKDPATFTFVATVTLKPEHEDEFIALMTATVEMVLANEPNTTLYAVHKHPTEPHTYVSIERYRDA